MGNVIMDIKGEHIEVIENSIEWLLREIGTEDICINITKLRNFVIINLLDIKLEKNEFKVVKIPDTIIKLNEIKMGNKLNLINNYWKILAKYCTKYHNGRYYIEFIHENGENIMEISGLI